MNLGQLLKRMLFTVRMIHYRSHSIKDDSLRGKERSSNRIFVALKEVVGFHWDSPFVVTMKTVRQLMDEYGFRFNYIRYALRRLEEQGLATRVQLPTGDEPDDFVVAELRYGLSEKDFEFYSSWVKENLLSIVNSYVRHVEPDSYQFYQYSISMRTCRYFFEQDGFTLDEIYNLFRQLEKDGFMKDVKRPDDSFEDGEVVAIMTKRIPHEYYEMNKQKWI